MSHEGVVESTGRNAFNMAMALAFQTHSQATHVLIDADNGCMIFFWHAPEPYEPWKPAKLYKEMTVAKAADYAWEWVRSVLKKTRPAADPDEMFEGGFKVRFGGEFRLYWKKGFEKSYSPADGSPYGICAVYPVWHEIHK